jgi:hypothetical protein
MQTPNRKGESKRKSMMRTNSGGYEIVEQQNGMSDIFPTKDITKGGQMSVGGKAYKTRTVP